MFSPANRSDGQSRFRRGTVILVGQDDLVKGTAVNAAQFLGNAIKRTAAAVLAVLGLALEIDFSVFNLHSSHS